MGEALHKHEKRRLRRVSFWIATWRRSDAFTSRPRFAMLSHRRAGHRQRTSGPTAGTNSTAYRHRRYAGVRVSMVASGTPDRTPGLRAGVAEELLTRRKGRHLAFGIRGPIEGGSCGTLRQYLGHCCLGGWAGLHERALVSGRVSRSFMAQGPWTTFPPG